MKKINRFKELEKLAKELGIGKDKKVKCVSCDTEIPFKEAIVLTNKKRVSYLCRDCNEKLENGDLFNEKKVKIDEELIKEIEKYRNPDTSGSGPIIPSPDWTIEPDWTYKGIENINYTVSSLETPKLSMLKLEPDYGN